MLNCVSCEDLCQDASKPGDSEEKVMSFAGSKIKYQGLEH